MGDKSETEPQDSSLNNDKFQEQELLSHTVAPGRGRGEFKDRMGRDPEN